MAETFPSDAALAAKLATTDTLSGLVYVTGYENPHLLAWAKTIWQFIGRSVAAGQVYKDGALTFGVRAGTFYDGDTERAIAAVTAQALTDDDTNYIYLLADGTLTVNITGFPNPSAAPHVRLATITTASGDYDADPAAGDLVDYRVACLFNVLTGDTGAVRNTLTADVPDLALSGVDDADGTGTMTIQVRDAANASLAQRFLVRVWIADAEFSEPDAQTDFSVTTGEQMREIEADADYEVISDASGTIVMNIDTAGDKTVYVMAEIDGRIYTGSVAITGN